MKKKFLIEWMTCASCVVVNENSLNDIEGVAQVVINLATNEASIEYDESKVNFDEIKRNIEWNWFSVNEDLGNIKKSLEEKDNKTFNRFILSLLFSLPIFLSMFLDNFIGVSLFVIYLNVRVFAVLSAIVVFGFWWHFHVSAFKSLLKFHFTMDSLVSLWTLTAFFYSVIAMNFEGIPVYFEAAVAIITLINLWKYLEHRAKTKAWDAIWKLLELWAKKAFVISWDKIIEKDIDAIKTGEIIVVKPWEKIALDGVILTWSASIDESMLTWESVPVFKEESEECFGWTINLDWNINLKVTKTNKEWTLANIIDLVNNAQSSKAPIQHLADKVSWIFVPIIIIISIITFISWYFITWNISDAIIAAVATLVIACPCALWLATPTAIMVWTWVWARNGILIKNAETLEKTKDIDSVVFDKTGTLTNWKPEVTDIINISKDKDWLMAFAKSLSSLSNHPLSKSIASYDNKTNTIKIDNFEEIKGKWVIWEIWLNNVKLWNKKLFSNLSDEIVKQIDQLASNWKTPIIVWDDIEIFWIIGLLDLPKTWVRQTIQKLHSMNIETIMLTWDTKNTAKFVANQIWIDKVISEVMPEDKLEVIKKLQAENKKVAFVGDGINDAPALVQSDLSIAMWTWSDIAIESSDIVLVKWNLEKVVSAINLSRQTLKVIKQNLFWAFVYNTIGIPLAAFGILNPIFASFAMSMSSVSVISNSLRLKLFK